MRSTKTSSKPTVTAGPHDSLESIADLMKMHKTDTVVIVEEQCVIGTLSDRDICVALRDGAANLLDSARRLIAPVEAMREEEDEILKATRTLMEWNARFLRVWMPETLYRDACDEADGADEIAAN